MNPRRELSQGARERHGDDAQNRQPNSRNKEAQNRREAVTARLNPQERRQDEVARAKEHREERHANIDCLPQGK